MTYTISQFSALTGISVYTLRFYEHEGILKPKRDQNNYRIFSDNDIDWITFIVKLKNIGASLHEIKRYTELREIGESTVPERRQLLLKHRERIYAAYCKVKSHLTLLDDKILLYDQMEKALKAGK